MQNEQQQQQQQQQQQLPSVADLLQIVQQQQQMFQQQQAAIQNLQQQLQQAPELQREERRSTTNVFRSIGLAPPNLNDEYIIDTTGESTKFREGKYTLKEEQLELAERERYLQSRFSSSELTKSRNLCNKPKGGFTTAGGIDPWIRNLSKEDRERDEQLKKFESLTREHLRFNLSMDALCSQIIEIIDDEDAESEDKLQIVRKQIEFVKQIGRREIEFSQHSAAEFIHQRRKLVATALKWSNEIKEASTKAAVEDPEFIFGNEQFRQLVKESEEDKQNQAIQHLARNSIRQSFPSANRSRGNFQQRGRGNFNSFGGRGRGFYGQPRPTIQQSGDSQQPNPHTKVYDGRSKN
jgi:hypothetical protein